MDMISTQEHRTQERRRNISGFPVLFLCSCVFVLLCSQLTGCTQLKQVQHLEPLLTLKDYSDENQAQGEWIDQEEAKFGLILEAARDGSIKSFHTKESVREQFGDPVVIENTERNSLPVEQWLYRHPIQKLAFEKVYLFFGADERLVRYEIVTPPNDGQKVVDFNIHSQDL